MSVESTRSFVIDAEGIDDAAVQVFDLLQEAGYDRRTCLRLRLSLDGILLDWMERGLAGADCTVTVERRFGRRTVSLEAAGRIDAKAVNEDTDLFFAGVVSNLGLEWDVDAGAAHMRATLAIPRKQAHPVIANVAAVGLAVAAGLVLRTLPQSVGDVAMGSFANPLFDAFIGLLSALVGPMVFFSVVVAVVGAGDLKSLKGMGKATLLRILASNFAGVCVAGVVAALFFGMPTGSQAAGGGGVADVVAVVLGIVPSNVVEPFASGNILQIVCLAFGSGVGILALQSRLPLLAKLSMECDQLIQEVLAVVMRFLPGFIFLAILRLVDTMDAGLLVSLLAVLGCVACVMGSMAAGTMVAAAVSAKAGPLKIARVCLPGGIVGLTTSSSAAAYTVVQDEMRKGFGITEVYAKFTQPIVTAFFQPGTGALFVILVFFAASFSQTSLSVPTLALTLVMCFLLGTTAPPVPGGMVMLYSVVLTQAGLGTEALAVFMAANFLFDALITGAETFMRPAHALRTALALGEVDRSVLPCARRADGAGASFDDRLKS